MEDMLSESKRLSLEDFNTQIPGEDTQNPQSSKETLNDFLDLNDDSSMDAYGLKRNMLNTTFPRFDLRKHERLSCETDNLDLLLSETSNQNHRAEANAIRSPMGKSISGEKQNSMLGSPLSPFADDLSMDGLRKHMVALNLNVDNHLSKKPVRNRPEFSISGRASMTPNPRIEFKSPQSYRYGDNVRETFGDFDGRLPHQILFDDDIDEDFSGKNMRHTPLKMRSQQSFDWIPPANGFDSLGMSATSGLNPPNPNFANLQPMQQVILPNGMPAMVIPMVDVQRQQGNTFDRGMPGQFQLHRSVSFDSGSHTSRRNKPMAPPGFGEGSKSFHQPRKTSLNKSKSASFVSDSKVLPVPSNVYPAETPLSNYAGSIFEMAKEQNGCRYLQLKIEADKEEACIAILHEIRPNLIELMLDAFGNYLFQKLVEYVNPQLRMEMLQRVKGQVVEAALSLHGTRSVQKLIEVCGSCSETRENSQQLAVIIDCIGPHVTKLAMDTNGNHVIQRCLQYMTIDEATFIYETALNDVMIITKHRHGCCVFQRCIDAADEYYRTLLVNKIVENAVQLMQDPFGNYVVQYVLDNDKCTKSESDLLISKCLGMLSKLSMQKFSSNVIEKCLLAAPVTIRSEMINEISKSSQLRNLLHDQYANYVVQRALLVADESQGMSLVKNILPHISELAKFNPSCAKRVSGRIMSKFPRLSNDDNYVKQLAL